MTNHEAEMTTAKVLDALLVAKTHEKIAFFAIFSAGGATFEHFDPNAYSNGEKKRAIKFLREAQSGANPDVSQKYEDAITHIRNNWLHKAA